VIVQLQIHYINKYARIGVAVEAFFRGLKQNSDRISSLYKNLGVQGLDGGLKRSRIMLSGCLDV
jgi:hypothetical protein